MNRENESASSDQTGPESKEAPSASAPAREPRQRRPTPFPRSDRAVSQADGEA